MKKWLKRIRGILGTGLTWAAAWSVVGTIIRSLAAVIAGGTVAAPSGSLVTGVVVLLVTFGVMGFIGGAAFSVVLGIAEGRRSFDQMSLPRFAAWGAAGGLLVSLFFQISPAGSPGISVMAASVLTLLGAGSAAGSLALARRADDRELLDAGADVAEVGLTEKEKRELLGK